MASAEDFLDVVGLIEDEIHMLFAHFVNNIFFRNINFIGTVNPIWLLLRKKSDKLLK